MSLTWDEVIALASIEATHDYDYRGYDIESKHPDKSEYVERFMDYYDELIETHIISSWPVDPPGSRRMAKGRAETAWQEDFPLE
ncbi:hypothetical protein HRTV-25_gp101 [Halorubrum tailed virus 25]|uniref:Uncharacterized protein n=1 Tax=Halorubrum tailed virus 25 TaxID=2878006 RepID=A0AAE8XXW0_9CAUD|nr:hypothetical protein M1M37_gp101 [Halorubrum tailed virus 25]UBF22682.1 hypothetical protein HRTV-25_gp101 [Halorubrum tailed virus 25]